MLGKKTRVFFVFFSKLVFFSKSSEAEAGHLIIYRGRGKQSNGSFGRCQGKIIIPRVLDLIVRSKGNILTPGQSRFVSSDCLALEYGNFSKCKFLTFHLICVISFRDIDIQKNLTLDVFTLHKRMTNCFSTDTITSW